MKAEIVEACLNRKSEEQSYTWDGKINFPGCFLFIGWSCSYHTALAPCWKLYCFTSGWDKSNSAAQFWRIPDWSWGRGKTSLFRGTCLGIPRVLKVKTATPCSPLQSISQGKGTLEVLRHNSEGQPGYLFREKHAKSDPGCPWVVINQGSLSN